MKTIYEDHLTDLNLRTPRLTLLFSNQHPKPRCYEDEDRKVFILGSPIYEGRIDFEAVKDKLLKERIESFIRGINGSFLFIIYDKNNEDLLIANDRFASVQFYYRFDNGTFVGATNYSDIWKAFRGKSGFRINREAFYEFIYMKRLYGDKTYDYDTRFLDSASILSFMPNSGRLTVSKYWQPHYAVNNLSLDENAHKLAFLLQQSFKRATSDSKRFGLLLSGGLDSRSILAASDKPLTCFTTCEYKNNEYLVANELSKVKDYKHLFITKPRTYYSDIINRAVYTSSAMNNYTGAHFFNIADTVREKTDILLHGYGFDFLFRGKYLPTSTHPLMKKLTYKRGLMPVELGAKDIAEEFIENISYRLLSIDSALLLKYKYRKKMVDSLYYEIKRIIDEAKGLSDDPYKWWDYCCFHNISRHYTWINLLSIRTFIEERIVAFDNELFDFYCSLDVSSYLNGAVFKDAIKLLNPRIYNIRVSNTNLSIDDPTIVTAAKVILNKALKETRLNRIFRRSMSPPPVKERSWPIDADLIRGNPKIREAALNLCNSSRLESLDFLNMDTVSLCVKEHIDYKKEHTSLIIRLITLDKFLKLD